MVNYGRQVNKIDRHRFNFSDSVSWAIMSAWVTLPGQVNIEMAHMLVEFEIPTCDVPKAWMPSCKLHYFLLIS